jgi:hypothetical protein
MPSIARPTTREVLVRKLIVALSCSLLMVGCAAKAQSRSSATNTTAASAAPAAADPNNKVIVHIVSQHQTITVTSSPNGLLYSLKDPNGHVQIAEATPEKFAELQPHLYQQIQNYIAVHADDAPIPSASINGPGVGLNRLEPTATREPAVFPSPIKSSDDFKRTADRPFPTAREDAPQ